jgi:hypothetical protein
MKLFFHYLMFGCYVLITTLRKGKSSHIQRRFIPIAIEPCKFKRQIAAEINPIDDEKL